MANPFDTLLLALGTVYSLIFAGFVFLDRRRIYAGWAKVIAIIAALGGFLWRVLQWVLLHSERFHLTREAYYQFVGHRGIVAGLVMGLTLSILIARPYQKVHATMRAV